MVQIIPLGSIVSVPLDLSVPADEEGIEVTLKGAGHLYVVGWFREDEEEEEEEDLLYTVSDIPVVYPVSEELITPDKLLYRSLATVVEHVFGEDLQTLGKKRTLYPTIQDWLNASKPLFEPPENHVRS